MGRLLEESVKNILWITDPVSNSRIGVQYRIPTSHERVMYWRAVWDPKKKLPVPDASGIRAYWGEKIFEGFTDGSFEKMIEGERRQISCNPESKDYFPEWREWIVKCSPDILEALGFEVFELYQSETKQGEDPPEKK